jgi:hypothetical protein
VNGEVHGGRPRPTGAVVPRKKNKNKKNISGLTKNLKSSYIIGTPTSTGITLQMTGNSV